MKTWQLMLALARYRPGLYFINGLLWVSIHLFPILPGLIIKAFFDLITAQEQAGLGVFSLIALLMAASLGRIGLIFAGVWTDVVHRFGTANLLRRNLLERILERPGARALPDSAGEAISRFRDDAAQAEDSISWTLDIIGTALFALFATLMLVQINARITLLVFLPLIGVVAVAQAASSRVERYRQAAREATGRVTGAIGEFFGAVQAVQVAGAEARVVSHFARLNDRRRQMMVQDRLLTEILESVFSNTVNIGTGLILILAADSMRDASFTVGDFALFVYYLTFVTEFTTFFGRFLAHYRQTSVAFRRMLGLLQGAPPQRLTAHRPLHLHGPLPGAAAAKRTEQDRLERLSVRGLTFHYPETGRGIKGVDLTLRRGSLTVITGRIGSGKSTLLRTLLGLLPAEAGEIRWNDRLITEPGSFFIPPRCAYTAQIPVLFSDTVQENILLGIPEAAADLEGAVHAAVFERDLAIMEQGLQTLVGSRGVRLSGGQIQRLAAARMFVREPELLVMDDLSSALDVETERALWERLLARPGATCLAVSHRRMALRRADQVILLQDGRVADCGTLDQLLERSTEMQRLWHGDEANGAGAAGGGS